MKTVNRRSSFCQSLKRHVATVVSGTELARQIHKEVQSDIAKLVAQGNSRPHLSVILVGDDHASHTYVRNKTRTASLLEHINERAICNAVAPEKDVDGFHIVNIGKLCLDQRCMVPATAAAVWEIIRRTGIETVGKNVLVVGRSKNVGMPIAMLLHSDRNHERPGGDATVIMAHRCTPLPRLKELASLADIVIAAAGQLFVSWSGVPHLITADMVKDGAAVIDVGINRIQDPNTGKLRLVGDVDFEVLGLMVVLSVFSGLGDTNEKSEDVILTNTTHSNGSEEEPRVLAVQRPCGPKHEGFCFNGVCSYSSDLETPICRCNEMYSGVRCEHVIMDYKSLSSPEEIIGISCGVVLLLGFVIVLMYCCLQKRCQKSSPPYKNCGSENSV
ncbi:putative bifunctional methylenetetrahydrofolate dehydrogenase cyclohydrolase 2 [Labeo rohita]|uniref:Putative bifunctional methylenetetrahydrofolate dehydrogenase cyclohydrolase 2 n=1 Tax=Labeo rohita TaxID=84645 RepID=A0A498MMY9_LABRO|nr:putative bifunctional methylenetetrahydrofolate dehydrogenase cyclohydrolase 2 [Labeo rohita]